MDEKVIETNQGDASGELPLQTLRSLSARVSTIMQQELPASAYDPLVQLAWRRLKSAADVGPLQLQALLEYAARQTAQRSRTETHRWETCFQLGIDDGISGRIWEQVVAHAPVVNNTGDHMSIRKHKAEETPPAKALDDNPPGKTEVSEDPKWGQGSRRLGPRWTTGRKRANFYDHVLRDFDEKSS